MSTRIIPALLCALSVLLMGTAARADMIFADDFESQSLSPTKWGFNLSGFVAVDPLNSLNHVLDFGTRYGGGDTFSVAFTITPGQTYTFSWDYLGTQSDAAGFAGLNWGPRGNAFTELWVGGAVAAGQPILMTNDNAWHHYSFDFTTADTSGNTSVQVKFENWDQNVPGSGSLNSALFDNVQVQTAAVPEPASFALLTLTGLGGLGLRLRRRESQQTAA